jgi:hypothetical protein
MARTKVNMEMLRALDTTGFSEFEAQVVGSIFQEEAAKRQARLEGKGGKKKRRRRR